MYANRASEQTRTAETESRYLKRASGLLERIAIEMGLPDDAFPAPADVVEYMRKRAGEWKWATFRQYQASLVCRYEVEFDKTKDPIFQATAQAIKTLPYSNCKPETELGGTSSRKRKGIPKRDFDVLVANLSNPKHGGDYAKRSALWLMSALATGLRPCEWKLARISDDGSALEVANAKATNGRGNGKTRMVPLSPEDAPVVRAHLESIAELRGTGQTFPQIHNRCGEALNRACRMIWGENTTKRYALYSARHQFAANTKATHTPEEVAALLGHRSTRTARRHYAPRRSAWLGHKQTNAPAPTPESTRGAPQT